MSKLTLKNAANEAVEYSFLGHVAGRSTTYIGTEHSDLLEDSITLSSVNPTRRATDYGNRRSRANLQRSVAVPTPVGDQMVQKNAKLECLASVPVGMTIEQFSELAARQAAFLLNPDYVLQLFLQGRTEQ